MIIEKLLELILNLLIWLVDLLSIPTTPDFLINTMREFYDFTLDGIRFAQYFFDDSVYSTFCRLFIALYILRPTGQLLMWAYNKIRGC